MMINRITFVAFFLLFVLQGTFADTIPANLVKQTYEFARKDTSRLLMDVYRKKGSDKESQPVMLFVFGGAFKTGTRDGNYYLPYFSRLSEAGITVVSIDYRLGLVDRKVTLFNTTAADDAINMAVEDLFSATRYLIDHAAELAIDTACIITSGSSAGAITVLQADYYLSNNMTPAEMLPAGFRYKGVLSFAGAIFSHKGTPDYKTPPAPTFFFHGSNDRVVSYNKLRLFRRGMFGSKSLAGRFKKRGFNYIFLTMADKGHSVAGSPMHDNLDMILWFIDRYVYEGKHWQLEATLKDQDAPVEKGGSVWGVVD